MFKVGDPVWCKMRSGKWRADIVVRTWGQAWPDWFDTAQEGSQRPTGMREAKNMRPRNPALNGKDRPE